MKFIVKNSNNAHEHISNSLLIYIYNFVKENYSINDNSLLQGNIETLYGYQSNVDYLEETFQNLHVMLSRDTYIEFEDELCKQYVANELGDGCGVTENNVRDLTFEDLKPTFALPEGVEKFNELKYFKSFTQIVSTTNDANNGECSIFTPAKNTLKEINIKNITKINGRPFYDFTNLEKVNDSQYVTLLSGTGAFYNSGLISINMPNITSLGSYGNQFDSCHNLTTVTIDGTVNWIAAQMFRSCENLKEVHGFSNITTIYHHAFYGCTSLETLDINFSTLETIDGNVFHDCTSLDFTNIDFSNVKTFGQECFRNTNLSNITFNLTEPLSFGYGVFRNTKLTTLTIPNNCNTINTNNMVQDCVNLTSLTFPTGLITSLGYDVARNCTALQTVYVGDSLVKINGNAFNGCTSLTSVNTLNNVTYLDQYIFSNCESLTNIGSLENCTYIGNAAFQGCKKLSNLGSLESVETIKNSGFRYLGKDLENPVLPNIIYMPNITKIEYGAFLEANIKHIKCPNIINNVQDYIFSGSKIEIAEFDNLLTLERHTFNDCKNLVSVSIPKVTSIKNSCFHGCTSLTTFSAPSCISISSNAFQDMGTVDTISLPKVTTISGGDVFYGTIVTNCDLRSLTSFGTDQNVLRSAKFVNLDIRSIESLTRNYFQNMSTLTTVNVSSLQSGPRYMFMGTSLETISLPSMTALPQDGFRNCSKLTTVTLSPSATEIGQSCFNTCSKLANIDISHIQIIRGWAFENCTSLTSIDLSSCTEMLEGAFKGCTGLNSDIVIPATVTGLPKECFYNCLQINSLTLMASSVVSYGVSAIPQAAANVFPIYVPDALVDSYKSASGWNNQYIVNRIKPLSQKPQ